MLLLVTVGLVLVGVIFLVIGFVQNSLALIYVSIACSALAAVLLVVFSRMSRREAAVAATAGGAGAAAAPVGVAATPERGEAPTVVVTRPAGVPQFPIADYEDLRVAQILPLLDELDDEELELVREREESTRNRATLLKRIDALVVRVRPASAGVSVGTSGGLAIADYDDLDAEEILPLLDELDDDELETIRRHEMAGRNRASVLDEIDDIFGEGEELVPVGAGAPAKAGNAKAAGKKAVVSKASGKGKKAGVKTPGRKATVKKGVKKAGAAKGVAAAKKAPSATKAGRTKAVARTRAAKRT